ncbi:ComEA family DNA-binding protein [Luteimonas sp. MC1828]|uniref:helix-hairpin-helix domain-containing protein n=1 Tax=Luteimonas sp. MC1828 TaxID=2799787 RepID=UPI0018F1AE3F|nr:ComEA family DNA-binding protein [Luteimonas sp. MC1828]
MILLKNVLAPVLLSLLLAGGAFASDKVNINTADAATIERVLVNIGMAKAEAIVAHRKAHGAFKSADELANVKGVGLKTIEKNRDRIVVGGGAAAKPAATAATAAKPAAAARPVAAKPAAAQR